MKPIFNRLNVYIEQYRINDQNYCPSIIELNTNSMLLQEKILSPNETFHDNDDDSLTDVSVMIQTKPLSTNYDQTSKYSNKSIEYKPIIQTDNSINYQLFQSLIDYANSFNLDETIYSIQNLNNQFDSTSYSTKLIPSNFFSTKKIEDYNSDENTTVTDGSKFDWDNFHSNKSLKKLSSSIIIREKPKNRFLRPTIDIQVLRSSTPIIVREILPKPSYLPLSSTIFTRSSKPPIIPKRKINDERISSIKSNPKIIIEYDQINVQVDKNIKRRKEIKRVNPNEYVQQYGSSLYSKNIFHNLLTNIIV